MKRRRGLTLVEMLVAMTCTILLMAAVTQLFAGMGEISSRGRAAIEMAVQMRGVQLRLHKDMQMLTVPVRPWPQPGAALGYLEYFEGSTRDATAQNAAGVFGDVDDILMFTVRSEGEPFVGKFVNPASGNVETITSNLAEVAWFTSFVDADGDNTFDAGESINIHRRVLLIRPDLNNAQGIINNSQTPLQFQANNDISVRPVPGGGIAANTLSDLSQRENRFAHVVTFNNSVPSNFPCPINLTNGLLTNTFILSGDRQGEDVMITNVIAWDVRAFDRFAVIKAAQGNGEAVIPGDPGYAAASTNLGVGTFVDLNHNTGFGDFSGVPTAKSGLQNFPTYDTWSFFYETDNTNDIGYDGLDNGGVAGAVDDVEERSTAPPYPVPLRALQVRFRVLEPETRQIRQSTVVQDFVPE